MYMGKNRAFSCKVKGRTGEKLVDTEKGGIAGVCDPSISSKKQGNMG